MGKGANQIATEDNVKEVFDDYIDTITSNKCVTVKRLLDGLCLSATPPVYNTSNPNSINSVYNLKSSGIFSAKTVTGYLNINITTTSFMLPSFDIPDAIIYSTATGYKTFDNDIGVCCFNNYYTVTISAKFTVTSGYRSFTASTASDDVSPASLDIDNPEEDTETNTDGQEPTIQPFSVGPIQPCQINLCARDYDVCSPVNITCQWDEGVSIIPCSCVSGYNSTSTASLQITRHTDRLDYSVYVGDSNNWTYVLTGYHEQEQTLNNSTSHFTVDIPIVNTFGISQTPTAAFGIKFEFSHYSATLAVDYTVKTPAMYVTVYNPSHKCVKYTDLPNVYKAYGKTVDSGSSSASVASMLGEFDEVPETE